MSSISSIKIVSYNVDAIGSYHHERYKRHACEIKLYDPDIIFIHEIDIRYQDSFTNEFPDYIVHNDADTKTSVNDGDESVRSLVLIKSLMKGRYKFKSGKLRETTMHRYYLSILINGIRIISCHAESWSSNKNKRYEQFKQIYSLCHAAKMCPNGYVFLGDLNTENSVGPFTSNKDCKEIEIYGCKTWFGPRMYWLPNPNSYTKRYDRCFISNNLEGSLKIIYSPQIDDKIYTSDHDGLLVEIKS
jgi:endonuclease/exonuclease/phosphatase family metal-dependent hydrolase